MPRHYHTLYVVHVLIVTQSWSEISRFLDGISVDVMGRGKKPPEISDARTARSNASLASNIGLTSDYISDHDLLLIVVRYFL